MAEGKILIKFRICDNSSSAFEALTNLRQFKNSSIFVSARPSFSMAASFSYILGWKLENLQVGFAFESRAFLLVTMS